MADEGDMYYKTVNIPTKGTIIAIITVSIILMYLVLSIAGIVPAQYNVLNLVTNEKGNTGNPIANNTENGTALTPTINKVMIYGIPKNININQTPSTSWQISFKIVSGSVKNLSISVVPFGLQNVTVSLSGDSNWNITGDTATYNGILTEGMIVYLTLTVNAGSNPVVYKNANISIEPQNVGITFVSSTYTINITQ